MDNVNSTIQNLYENEKVDTFLANKGSMKDEFLKDETRIHNLLNIELYYWHKNNILWSPDFSSSTGQNCAYSYVILASGAQ